MELELRDYQKEIIEKARKLVAMGKRRLLVQIATGTGKTITSIGIMHSAYHKGFRSIFFAHRRELVDQTAQRFMRYGIKPRILMAGRELEDGDENLYIASYQTFERRKDYFDGEFDVVFFDEAHIGVDRQRRVLEHILNWRPNAVVIGLTATPMTNSGPGLGSIYDELIQGPRLEWFIERGYLAEPQHLVMQEINPDEMFRIKGLEYDEEQVFEWMRGSTLVGDIISNYQENFMGERFILFANSVKASVWLAEQFGRQGIPVAHLDYNTPDKVRKEIISKFRDGKILGISNVDILSEGFDVPDMSLVILASPTASLVRYIQRAGRALRPAPGKDKAYIVDHSGTIRKFGTIYNYQEWALEPARPDRRNKLHAVKVPKRASERVCPVCKTVLKPSARFCSNCGNDFYKLPPGQRIRFVPGIMVEYEEYIRKSRRGEVGDCAAVKRLPEMYKNMPQLLMDEILGWIRERSKKGKATSEAFADVLYYSITCRCPSMDGVSRKYATPRPTSEWTRKMIKRYFALKNQGFYKFEGGFPCWKKSS